MPQASSENMRKRLPATAAFVVFLLCTLAPAGAQEPGLDPAELDRLSLEEILGIDVASATKTAVPLAKAPVSVRVITADEIARSAVRTLPELLRQVAGVDVRWNPMVPVISMRGFGQLPFSSRVLFLL